MALKKTKPCWSSIVFQQLSFTLKLENWTLSLSHSSSGVTDETRFDMKNSEAETETCPGTVQLVFSWLFPQTQTPLTSLRVFSVAPPPPPPPNRLLRRWAGGKVKSLRSSASPRGLFISSAQHFSPLGNMSGVIGEARQRYSN